MATPDQRWYITEKNTSVLMKNVITARPITGLSGIEIWQLARLTWITGSENHWRSLKVPALAALFRAPIPKGPDLQTNLANLNIPNEIRSSALHRTGFTNFYNAYRNSCKTWCTQNTSVLKKLLLEASQLRHDDSKRLEIARKISELPMIPHPDQVRHLAAQNLLSPLIACIDPIERFPIINGRERVQSVLTQLGLAQTDLSQQVRGLLNLIGQFGIEDAFRLDTRLGDIPSKKPAVIPVKSTLDPKHPKDVDTALKEFDEEERIAINSAKTLVYRTRHNRMTNRLRVLFSDFEIRQGKSSDCRYDALIVNYDNTGRDLLIEAKPDPDNGSLRVALGQLLHYRQSLPNKAGTDLALLTLSKPSDSWIELLNGLRIKALWFTSNYESITCTGNN